MSSEPSPEAKAEAQRILNRAAARIAAKTWGGRWEAVQPDDDDHISQFDGTLADGLDEE
jgi:hypothetical protein